MITTAQLQDFIAPEDKKKIAKEKDFNKVEPVYLNKLVHAVGNQQDVGAMLGYTPSGISHALSDVSGVRMVVELAAKLIYQEKYEIKPKPKAQSTVIITHFDDHLPLIKSMVKSIGGTYTVISDGGAQ